MQFCLGKKLYLHKPAEEETAPWSWAPSWSKHSNQPRPSEVEEFVYYPILTPTGSRWQKDRTNAAGQSCWFNFCLSPSILCDAEPIPFDTSHEDAALLFSGSASLHYPSRASSAVAKSFLVLALIPTLSILPNNLYLYCSADLWLSCTPHLGKPGIRLVNFLVGQAYTQVMC